VLKGETGILGQRKKERKGTGAFLEILIFLQGGQAVEGKERF